MKKEVRKVKKVIVSCLPSFMYYDKNLLKIRLIVVESYLSMKKGSSILWTLLLKMSKTIVSLAVHVIDVGI